MRPVAVAILLARLASFVSQEKSVQAGLNWLYEQRIYARRQSRKKSQFFFNSSSTR